MREEETSMSRRGFITLELLVFVMTVGIVLAITIHLGMRLREAGHPIAGGVLLYGPFLVLAGMAVFEAVRIVKSEGWIELLKTVLLFGLVVFLIFGVGYLCGW
jgi:hypothetical protein